MSAVEMLCNSGVRWLWMGLVWHSQAAACCGSVSTGRQRQTQAGDSCLLFGTNPPAFLVCGQALQVLVDQLTVWCVHLLMCSHYVHQLIDKEGQSMAQSSLEVQSWCEMADW